jgi:hypothetical protein
MSAPTSSATIEFPAARIDEEIRKLLEEEGVRFEPQISGPGLELDSPAYDLETEIKEDGVFYLNNPEARYGEFYDLEELLVQKGIPFDRTSYMDWNRPPELRVYRPGEPHFDYHFPLDSDGYEPVVSVAKIREFLALDDAGEEGASAIRRYLEEEFPPYPSLTDGVMEEGKHEHL